LPHTFLGRATVKFLNIRLGGHLYRFFTQATLQESLGEAPFVLNTYPFGLPPTFPLKSTNGTDYGLAHISWTPETGFKGLVQSLERPGNGPSVSTSTSEDSGSSAPPGQYNL